MYKDERKCITYRVFKSNDLPRFVRNIKTDSYSPIGSILPSIRYS